MYFALSLGLPCAPWSGAKESNGAGILLLLEMTVRLDGLMTLALQYLDFCGKMPSRFPRLIMTTNCFSVNLSEFLVGGNDG